MPELPTSRPPLSPPPRPSPSELKTRGANRSSKVAGKLKVLPEQPTPPPEPAAPARGPPKAGGKGSDTESSSEGSEEDDGDDEEEEEGEGEDEDEVQDFKAYNQITMISDATARRDALRLTKKKAKSLPRVTAYATAGAYRLSDLMKFLNARRNAYRTNPMLIDDVIYTPYIYEPLPPESELPFNHHHSRLIKIHSQSKPHSRPRTGDLLGVPELRAESTTVATGDAVVHSHRHKKRSGFDDPVVADAEIFLFNYGTVVIWGMTEAQEKRFLSSIKRFEVDKLPPDEVEMEDLNFYYANYSRIYNDVITLRKGSNYITKLALSHALSQSVKISLFEELVANTIEDTKSIPETIMETGKIPLPHKEIMMKIGELFLLRTNINSVGSVLDSPDFFWTFSDLEPLYEATRSYLEIPQRTELLNTRVEILQDMLALLKESVSARHGERLEKVVLFLVALECVIGVFTILVDLYASS